MRSALCIGLTASLLAGCLSHTYRGSPLPLECTDFAVQVQRGLGSGVVCSGDYFGRCWWSFFEDPQLNQLIELALTCHPDIKMAEARIALAYDEALERRSKLFPHLFGFASATREKVSEFGSRVQGAKDLFTEVSFSLGSSLFELDLWKRNQSLYRAALCETAAEIAEYAEVELLLSKAIASVYVALQFDLERLAITQKRLQTRKQVYNLLYQQFKNGIIDEFHLYSTDIEVQVLRDEVYKLEAVVGINRHALAALVGNISCCSEGIEVMPAAMFEKPVPLPRSLPIDLLARRPDVVASQWQIEAACFDVRAAKAEFFPRIDLVGSVGNESFKLGQLLTGKTLTVLGEALSVLPIFTAGKLRAKLGIAHERVEIAVERYNQTVLLAVEQVSDALTTLQSSHARVEALQNSIQDAMQLYSLTEQRFTQGVANRIAVLNALEDLLVQRDLEKRADLDRFLSAIDLMRALGGGYDVKEL